MFIDLLVWWYKEGWQKAWRQVPVQVKKVSLAFSLPVLLNTLFSPWKQIMSMGGRSLDEKFRAMVDNLVSRLVGFFVRFGVLLAALAMILLVALSSFVLAVIWPLVPLIIIYAVFRGITG